MQTRFNRYFFLSDSTQKRMSQLCTAVILAGVFLAVAPAVSAASYYLDCDAGDDSLAGTSQDTAWKTVAKVNDNPLVAGDALFLKRGCNFDGPLEAGWNGSNDDPITIDAYGTGDTPFIYSEEDGGVVRLDGQYVTARNLEVSAARPPSSRDDVECPTGWRIGFAIQGNNNTVESVRASGMTAGVHIGTNATDNRVLRSELVDNTNMSVNTEGGDDDSGSWGVVLNGDRNEIAYNYFTGNSSSCSFDYGGEGASVEVYEAQDNFIHHNRAIEETTFTELGSGDKEARGNIFAYNLYTLTTDDGGEFLNVRGPGNFGPTRYTVAHNNTVYLTGSQSEGVICSNCLSEAPEDDGNTAAILSLYNNILWVDGKNDGKVAFASKIFDEGNNVYWSSDGNPFVQYISPMQMAASSMEADPGFVDAAAGDFRLTQGSPAIDVARSEILDTRLSADLAGQSLPQDGTLDIGAYEYEANTGGDGGGDGSGDDEESDGEPGEDLSGFGNEACLRADINGDITVDITDYSLLTGAFLTDDVRADIDQSGFVDLQDYSLFVRWFGEVCPQ